MLIRMPFFATVLVLAVGAIFVDESLNAQEAPLRAGEQGVTTERVEVKATHGTVATLDAGVEVKVGDVKRGWVGITVEQNGQKVTGWVTPGALKRKAGAVVDNAAAVAAFEQGYAAHRKGKFSAAIADYTEAIRLDPNYAKAYNNRAMAYQAKRDLNRAIADFSAAISISPTLAAAYLNRGLAFLSEGNVNNALDDFTEAIRLDPKSAQAYRMRAAIYESQGHLDMAAEDMARAARAYQPKYTTIAHRAMKFELETKSEMYPPNYEMLDAIIDEAKARIKTKKSYTQDDAMEILKTIDAILLEKRFLHAQPGLVCDALVPRKLPPQVANTLDSRVVRFRPRAGQVVFLSNSYATSFLYAAIGEALELPIRMVLTPGHAFVRWYVTNKDYINWETTLGTTKTDKEYKTWRHISDAAIKNGLYLTPLSQSGLLSCVFAGIGRVWQGEWGGLDNEFTPRQEQPQQQDVKAARGGKPSTDEQENKEDMDKAKEEAQKKQAVRFSRAMFNYTKALDLNKKLYEIWLQRAMSWTRVGQFDKALADLGIAMQLDPEQPAGYLSRGIMYQTAGSDKKAIDDFTKVIEMTPKGPVAYHLRGITHTHSNELDKAMDDLNKAIELQPQFLDAYVARSKVWEKLGQRDRAAADLRKVRELQLQR